MDASKIMFALIRSELEGSAVGENTVNCIDENARAALYSLSNAHDLAHVVGSALSKCGKLADDEISKKFQKKVFMAVYRYEGLQYELERCCDALEKARIEFMPLKGSVLRKYYIEPWLRTSCDIDILVREEDAERAASVLVEACEYEREGKGPHDVSLFSPNKNHIELHYDLIEDGRVNSCAEILRQVWDVALAKEGYAFWREMPDSLFYFYHIAHAAKHFEDGGCGVRPLIDLWILDNMQGVDKETRDELLKRGNLWRFAEVARKLSRVWLCDEAYDPLSEQMESYILRGGVYGTTENRVVVHQQRKGGKFKYVLSKIFLPYDTIKFQYPVLQKHRWLTPFMQVRRWCKLIFCGHSKRVMRELKYNRDVSNEEAERTREFLQNIGL